jgi:hypothetical protein
MSDALRILGETRIGIEEVQKLLGTPDSPVHFSTAYRAMKSGLRTPSGDRACLEHLRIGGRLISSLEAVERFVAAINGLEPQDAAAGPARSKARQRELDRIEAELNAAGI